MHDPTHFERLGLPRRFRLDAAELERNYLARSREVHPDFTGNDPASLGDSAALNEAYTTLRDPFRRAEYLLTVEGGPSAADSRQMPAPFLEEMLDLRMRIEEVKEQRDPDRAGRLQMEMDLVQRRDGLLEEAAKQFDRLATAPDRAGVVNAIRQTLNATKFVQGLLRDLREE
ncbi:MAG TPA: Fe-S protein assembly co-chaperone HscB [Gemmataceae bacterium]|jgi:molecular chaperone HscB|nr:Fe-S protein assembly co-chaperone HscB [Gemmataceae bacterium]